MSRATARRLTESPAPRHPRRVSGPLRTTTPGARMAASTIALPAPAARPTAPKLPNPLERIRALPDHRLLDGLLRSNAWIWLIGIALGGIVAMQVSLLKLNAGISRAVESSATLERQNAELEIEVARLSSEDRIRSAASRSGLVAPDAGTVGWVTSRPERDVTAALRVMRPPGEGPAAIGGGVTAVQPQAPVAPLTQPQTLTQTQTAPAAQNTASQTAPPTEQTTTSPTGGAQAAATGGATAP